MIMYKFEEKKATQVASYFLKLNGGAGTFMYILKLMYHADREALRRWGMPVSSDMAYNMDLGPVLSNTYNLMKDPSSDYWASHIRKGSIRHFHLKLEHEPEFDELSDREERLIDEVFAEHGQKSGNQLSQESHSLEEWEDPKGSSNAIDYMKLLKILGKSDEAIESLDSLNREIDAIDRRIGAGG